MKTFQILGFTIHSSIENLKLNGKKLIINTINPHCYCEAKKDAIYREALLKSDILIPDGIGIVYALKILAGETMHRITGADLHQNLLEKLNTYGGKVFYMGSAQSTLEKIEKRLKTDFPKIKVGSYSPPFKSEFTEEDNAQIIKKINNFQPDVVFIGMTAPKQEKWSFKHKDLIDAKIIASVGAVFDFYAGTIKRPGKFWQKTGLEFLPRLLREPKRLWRRNFISTPRFLWDVLKAKLGLLKAKQGEEGDSLIRQYPRDASYSNVV